jgi:general secretion pathway protein G
MLQTLSHPGTLDSKAAIPQVSLRRSISQAGYSLLEILVVLVIIGLIGSLVGPGLMARLDSSKVQTAEVQVRQLKAALDIMRLDIGRYPTPEEGLALLVTPPTDTAIAGRWRGPYMERGEVPKDPWSNPFQYGTTSRPNQALAVYSFGPTGKFVAEGRDASIGLLP